MCSSSNGESSLPSSRASADSANDVAGASNRRLVWAILLLALVVRLVYFLQIQDNPFFESPVIDALTYHERALALARGEWHEEEVFWQPPLYPYFLGAVYSVFGPKIAVARLLQLLLGAATCALTAFLAKRLHGSVAGWTAGATLAFCGTMIFFEGQLLNPVLSTALNMGALLVMIPGSRDGPVSAGNLSEFGRLPLERWLAAGVLLGLSAVSRPDVLVFAGVVALAPLLNRGAPMIARWSRLVLFTGAVLVPIAPVTAHNVVFGGEWVPISSNAGLNFYLGNSGEYSRTVGIRPGLHWEQLTLEPVRAGVADDDAGGKSAWWTLRGLSAIKAAPGRWLSDLGRKAGRGIAAVETGRNLDLSFFSRYAPLLRWLPGWGVIFPLGAVGAFLAWRRQRNSLLLALLASYALTLLVFFVSARYRLPMIPVLAILAGFAVDRVWFWWRADRRAHSLAMVGAVLLIGVVVRLDWIGADRGDEADGHYHVAKAFANRDRHAAAVESLQKALAVDPQHWDAVFDLAAAWTNLGQPQRSIPLYEWILANHPEDRATLLAMTDVLLRLGREQEAIEQLSESATSPQATSDLVFNVCRKLFSLGKADEAVRVGTVAVGQGVRDAYVEELLGKMESARVERAHLAACLEARLDPGSGLAARLPPMAHDSLSRAEGLLQRGEHLDAELLAADVLTDCDDYAAAWSLLGKLWFLQRSPLAPAALRHAIRLDPRQAEAHLGLAHALAADPRALPEAVAALEAFLELSPEGTKAEGARRALAGLATRQERSEVSQEP